MGLLIGIAAGILTFQSHVSVTTPYSLDQNDPFQTVFEVRNESALSLTSVYAVCYVNGMQASTMTMRSVGLIDTHSFALDPGSAKDTAPCRIKAYRNSIRHVDFNLIVLYQPKVWWFTWPFRKHQEFNFSTLRDADGRLQWVQGPA